MYIVFCFLHLQFSAEYNTVFYFVLMIVTKMIMDLSTENGISK